MSAGCKRGHGPAARARSGDQALRAVDRAHEGHCCPVGAERGVAIRGACGVGTDYAGGPGNVGVGIVNAVQACAGVLSHGQESAFSGVLIINIPGNGI